MEIIRINGIPSFLIDYAKLIILEKSPYSDIVKHIVKEMELHYQRAGKSEVVCVITPQILVDELNAKVENQEKLTTHNVCLTIRAFCCLCGLKEGKDFFTTTRSHGRKNYHLKDSQKMLSSVARIL